MVRNPDNAIMVYVVDDEESVRKGFCLLLRSAGIRHRAFCSAEQLLAEIGPDQKGCVLLDITMPRMTGLELQRELRRRQLKLSVIAISARDDEDTSTLARQLGARFFFRKPVDDQALIDAIRWVTIGDSPDPAPPANPTTPNTRTPQGL